MRVGSDGEVRSEARFGDVASGEDQSCLGGSAGGESGSDGPWDLREIGNGDGLVETGKGGRAGDPKVRFGGGGLGFGSGGGGEVTGFPLGGCTGREFRGKGGEVAGRFGCDKRGGGRVDGDGEKNGGLACSSAIGTDVDGSWGVGVSARGNRDCCPSIGTAPVAEDGGTKGGGGGNSMGGGGGE